MISSQNQRLQNQGSVFNKRKLREDVEQMKQQLLRQNLQLKNILSFYVGPLKESNQAKQQCLRKWRSTGSFKSSKQDENEKHKTKVKAKHNILLSSSLCRSSKTMKSSKKNKHSEDSFFPLKPKYSKDKISKNYSKCQFCKDVQKLKIQKIKKSRNLKKLVLSPSLQSLKLSKSTSKKSEKNLCGGTKKFYPHQNMGKVQLKNQTLKYLRL